jgi:hypothetical protein
MEDIKKQAELYAESFRYKIDDAGWYEQKVRDFIAGYEAALRIHDVVLRSEQLESGLTCMMCRKPKENDVHTCCEECAGLAF